MLPLRDVCRSSHLHYKRELTKIVYQQYVISIAKPKYTKFMNAGQSLPKILEMAYFACEYNLFQRRLFLDMYILIYSLSLSHLASLNAPLLLSNQAKLILW